MSKEKDFIDYSKIGVPRFENVVFGQTNKIFCYYPNIAPAGESVTDDSNFIPRVKQVRDFIASGGKPSDLLGYDFDDGVDNGFNPRLRALRPDPVDIDNAANAVIQEASEKVSEYKAAAEKAAAEKAAAEKAAAEKAGDTNFISNSSDSKSE